MADLQPEPPLYSLPQRSELSSADFQTNVFLGAGKNDLDLHLRVLRTMTRYLDPRKRYRGVVIPEILFYYRVRPDSMIRGISTIKKLSIAQYISEKHKEFYGTFATEIFNLSNANGPGIFLDNPALDYDLADKIRFGGK
jgi:hypothetical protein